MAKSASTGVNIESTLKVSNGSGFLDTTIVLPGSRVTDLEPIPLLKSFSFTARAFPSGKITNVQLLETMPIRDKKTGKITGYHDKSIDYKNSKTDQFPNRTTKQGTAKIGAVVKKLESNGYIIIHREISGIEKIPLGGGRYGPDKPITVKQVMYEITPAGRRQARDKMMDGKKWKNHKWDKQEQD